MKKLFNNKNGGFFTPMIIVMILLLFVGISGLVFAFINLLG